MSEKSYHHGDLRTALIDAGLAALEASGGEGVSLRELARKVGVSATAVYRHFPDKDALMAALARVGLDRLAIVQRAASTQAGGGAQGFYATGAAYVRFALDNPGLYRMIFAHPPSQDARDPAHKQDDAMAMLQASARTYAPKGTDPQAYALQSWALVHGLAMLLLDGQTAMDDAAIAAVIAAGR